jgi:hypothetical protein
MKIFTEWMKSLSEERGTPIQDMLKELLPLAKQAASGQITPERPDDTLRHFNMLVSQAIKHVDDLENNQKAWHYAYELRDDLDKVAHGKYGRTPKDYQQAAHKLFDSLRHVMFALTGKVHDGSEYAAPKAAAPVAAKDIKGLIKEMLPLSALAASGEISPAHPDDRLREFNGLVTQAIRRVHDLGYEEKARHYEYELHAALDKVAHGKYGRTPKDYQQAVQRLHTLLRSAHFALTGEID